MTKPKIKLEVTDANGSKISVTMSGAVDPAKVQKILSIIGDVQKSPDYEEASPQQGTLMDLVYNAVQYFGNQWFDSRSAKQILEEKLGRDVPLPVVSTYLSRMKESGRLLVRGSRVHREYHLT